MKFNTFCLVPDCWNDCATDMQECENDTQGAMVYLEDLKEMLFLMAELKAHAIDLDWLSESGEISEDAPGWVSLMINLNK